MSFCLTTDNQFTIFSRPSVNHIKQTNHTGGQGVFILVVHFRHKE